MTWHCWRCHCGAVLEQVGPSSLALSIQAHQYAVHAHREDVMPMGQVVASFQYSVRESAARPDASLPYSGIVGVATPTVDEHVWLRMQDVTWSGDNRTAEELNARYKAK
jgi:hypothetical protein